MDFGFWPYCIKKQRRLTIIFIVAANSAIIFEVENSNTAPVREQCMVPSSEPFMPNSPRVVQYSTCGGIRVELPENRRTLDFPSVLQFVADHTICRLVSLLLSRHLNKPTTSTGFTCRIFRPGS